MKAALARTHIIGAGLAGLAAAVNLTESGRPIALYEQARMAGGRCRSYFDAALGMEIDNGNHLLLSCNHAALGFLNRIGAQDALTGPAACIFDFYDLKSTARWRLHPNAGRLPWWIFSAKRRVPNTTAWDYLRGASLLLAGRDQTTAQALRPTGVLWENMWKPVLVSALNTRLDEASAHLAAAIVRDSLGAGGANARPLVPARGLGAAFIDPALKFLRDRGIFCAFGARLRGLRFEGARVVGLDFSDRSIDLGPHDQVILAAPAWIARELVPNLSAPTQHRSILNAHFAYEPPKDMPLLTGVVGGLSEWLFAFPGRLSVTISAADALIDSDRADLADLIWREIRAIAGLGEAPLPAHRIVKEKRATFAATPAQDALRPGAKTGWENLWLAGDWTQTGLPATIEGAIRSGDRAADSLKRFP